MSEWCRKFRLKIGQERELMIDRKGKVAPWPLCPTLWFRGAKEAGTHISRRTKEANGVFFSEDFFTVLSKSICWLG